MNIQVSPQLEAMIQQRVESGVNRDANEVVEHALQRMAEQDSRAEQLRAAIAEGFQQIERGESIELTPERMELIMRRAVENARNGKPVKDDVKP